MNNRAFRVDDNSINSFTPSYTGTQGAIATHSNLSATTVENGYTVELPTILI